MLFPVLGQAAGIMLILGPVYFYRQYFLMNIAVQKLQENIIFVLLGLILIIIPGFAVFLKAFWDYMVVMVSLNTMAANVAEKKEIGNFKVHNDKVKLRSRDYITLLLILMAVWLVLIAVPFLIFASGFIFLNKIFSTVLFGLSALACIIILAVVSVYLCLSFQIFAFENINPLNVIKTSFKMMETNFWRAIVLGVILFVLTNAIVPFIFQIFVKSSSALGYLTLPFESYLSILSDNPIIAAITEQLELFIPDLAQELALSLIGVIVTAFILPLGSACFTLFYFDIKKRSQLA